MPPVLSSRPLLAPLAALLAGCTVEAPPATGEVWPEADALFHQDPRWLGGDGAYTMDLGGGRVLWSFGDSFIASDSGADRSSARMIRNSVALQTGYDPSRAFLRFYWREEGGEAQSFLAEEGALWHWPGAGIRHGEHALWFAGQVSQESPGPWGFAPAGWAAWLIENPDDEPSRWRLSRAQTNGDLRSVQLGDAIVLDLPWLYVFGRGGDTHSPYLARFDAERALAGDLRDAAWWNGSAFGAEADRRPLFRLGAPEFSVHFAASLGSWVYCSGVGFGATTVTLRTAPRLTGPWSQPTDVIRPPEATWPQAFVYAAKAHPELHGADLVATYVPSSHADLPDAYDATLYYPHFLRLTLR